MDQRTKNRDVAAAVPPIKQRESETNQGIVIEKEQQQEKVSIGDKEEEAEVGEEEDHKQQQGKNKEGNIDSMKKVNLSLKRSDHTECRDILTLK
jgi:hypothetical protein